MSNFRDVILVRGGHSGKKLHRAWNGSSCLSCGHWTKTSVTNFEVADNAEEETLLKFKADGYELCEKCFPQYATEEKEKSYTGPKAHLVRMRDIRKTGDNKITFKRLQGAACSNNRNLWNVSKLVEFSKIAKATPERCCKGCLKEFERIKTNLAEKGWS